MIQLGKIPPQTIELEEIVLGTIMLESDAFDMVKDFLYPDHFYKEIHRLIYKAFLNIKKKNNPIDTMSVVMELKSLGQLDIIGGPYQISILTNRISSSQNLIYHARIVYQKWIQREMIRLGQAVQNDAYDEGCDVMDLLSEALTEFRKLETSIIDEGNSDNIDQVIKRTFDAMNSSKENKGVLGYSMGIKTVDDFLCGLQKKTVYVIAARPGMGKSALVKTIFVNLAIQKVKVKLFSLEVSAEKFMMNIFSDILETNNKNVFQGNLSSEQMLKLTGRLEEIKHYMDIDDKAAITVQYLEKKVKQAVKDGCQVIMIDYLQLMRINKTDVDPRNREQQIAFLTGNIKRIANEYDIPIIELAQLNREVEKRSAAAGGQRPVLSDLRDGGSIEQDAEAVMFIYRPEYYGTITDNSGNDLRGLAEIIIAKNRNGSLGRAVVRFTPEYTKFEDLNAVTKMENSLFDESTEVIIKNNSNNPEF